MIICVYSHHILYAMENNNLILTSGAGIASSVIMQGAVSPSLDMSQWASALTQLAIAIITVVQLLKKKKD